MRTRGQEATPRPRRATALRVAAAVAAGGALGVGIYFGLDAFDVLPSGDAPGAATQGGPPAPDARAGSSTSSPSKADDSADPADPSDPADPADPDRPTVNQPGIEAAPQPSSSPAPPGAVGPLPVLPALVVPPGPASPETAQGALVASFPREVIALSDTATVLTSSASGDGRRLLVTVEASDTAPPADVLDRTTLRLVALGFTWSTTPAADGGDARTFLRDGHTVSVAVRPQADGALLRIVGILDETS
ncbi:hypothetical protein [Microbacterium stercoris]|uniref:Uncharacterized protein n=1 Tax=Microbacterium stercoris TaxID=2820289 RepID=A0A939QKT0_9MICO|nr:hypothetical protein [Microbacterium stercoris]MBO3662605.1 hypothetical protein [Microbacterium stercoris]